MGGETSAMARYKQSYTNSCGAAALMCAASELGKTTLPKHGKWAFMESSTPLTGNTAEVGKALLSWNGDSFEGGIVNGGKTVETALYAVTSGDLSSYSMPSRVIGCAKQLGLTTTMYAASGFYKSVLSSWYAQEMEACKAQGLTINEQVSPGPAGGQRELVVFATWIVGLHWIMRRPGGSEGGEYMDPGEGKDYSNFTALTSSWATNYKETGISLIFS